MSTIINPNDGMIMTVKNIGDMLQEHFGETAQLGIHLINHNNGKAILIPCKTLHTIELTGEAQTLINAQIKALADKLQEQMEEDNG
jgi:hypothetical protein